MNQHLHMTQNFLTLGWWNLVGRQGWLSRLLKLHHVAHLWWVLMFDTFLYWSQLQPVMKCKQPYTAERRNMLGNMSPRNRRFAKTRTLHPEARHIVCQLSVIDNWVVSRCIDQRSLVWGDVLNSQISSQRDNTDDKYFFTGVVYQEMFLRLAMWQNQYFRAIEEKNEICRWYGTQK